MLVGARGKPSAHKYKALYLVKRCSFGSEIDGEFDPGSGQTLAACLRHASRTGSFGFQWRTGEERVENLPRDGGYHPEMGANTAYDARLMG